MSLKSRHFFEIFLMRICLNPYLETIFAIMYGKIFGNGIRNHAFSFI